MINLARDDIISSPIMSFSDILHRYLLSPLLSVSSQTTTTLSSNNKSRKPISSSVFSYLNDFDIDPTTGFMPNKPLPNRLPKLFKPWEEALASAPFLLSLGDDNDDEALAKRESSRLWRLKLVNGPILPIDSLLDDVPCLQRAHHVLAFLVHFYMHSIPLNGSSEPLVVPASLAVPLVAVSDRLGIAPILTFADTVLWNWTLKDSSKPLSADNIEPQTLFTQSDDERNFYNCCASIELRGVEALRIILDYDNMSSSFTGDSDFTLYSDPDEETHTIQRISEALARLARVVDELTEILQSVRSTCDPHAFYFRIRPWFRGSDANGPDSPGWVFEGVDPSRQLELSGPSAGQSSTMHALDVFLDVDHQLAKPRLPAPSEQNRRADHTFMTRMRKYMPGKHQEFLLYLASHHRPVRDLASRTHPLRQPYDSVVLALKRFRDQHMRIACLYVVSMSRSAAATIRGGCPVGAMMMEQMQQQQQQRESDHVAIFQRQPVRGTGGNELSCLLKASRDATVRTLLSGNIN
ncbi:hypothetical protein Clacol_006590 [Clathrus columnatus]|uniref:Indoleamine 2,3-dioxygenase n=1 Tax=Clathrus columnatus TaxID=1419009 RepID=A0AAV5AGQ7_9AGAM|nr:hypothetical protein Clacol_006590 [Clathrus columnatus]